MGSKGRTGQRPPPNVSAHTYNPTDTHQPPAKVGRGTSRLQSSSAHANGGASGVKKRFSLAARHRFFWQDKRNGVESQDKPTPPPNVSAHPHPRKSPPACTIKKAAPGGDRFCFISRPAGRVSFCARWRGGRGSAWGRSPGGRPACRRRAGPWRSSRTCRNSPSGRRGSIRGRRWRCRTSRR